MAKRSLASFVLYETLGTALIYLSLLFVLLGSSLNGRLRGVPDRRVTVVRIGLQLPLAALLILMASASIALAFGWDGRLLQLPMRGPWGSLLAAWLALGTSVILNLVTHGNWQIRGPRA